MADAYCGPSNPLQNLQKHTNVDRTLQQDRLATRHGPSSQGFRSGPGPNAGLLDPEFEAFQAGFPPAPSQPAFHPQQHLSGPAAPPAQLPGWAADFQRLNISSPAPAPAAQFHAPRPAQQAANSWHLDFLQQQQHGSSSHAQAHGFDMPAQIGAMQHPNFMPAGSFFSPGADWGQFTPGAAKGKQREQEPQFDESAMADAFEAAMAEHKEAEATAERRAMQAENQQLQEKPEQLTDSPENAQEQERYQSAAEFEYQRDIDAELPTESDVIDQLRRPPLAAAPTTDNRVNQTGMGDELYNVHAAPVAHNLDWRERELAEPAPPVEDHTQTDRTEQQSGPRDEELAQAAGQLLASVSDDTSQKFQESNFLALMRRLRDHEVRVEGDQMVETQPATVPPNTAAPSHSSSYASTIPPEQQDADLARHGAS